MSKVKFTTSLDEDLVELAKIEAIKRKISVAQLLEELLKEYFKITDNAASS